MRFVFENNDWWQVHGDKVYGILGLPHKLNKNLPITEADGWHSLDWSCLLKRNSQFGWIAPDGTWFGCNDDDIGMVAQFFLKTTERNLENSGWIKIYKSDITRRREWYSVGMMITDDQAITLCKKGFLPEQWQIKED